LFFISVTKYLSKIAYGRKELFWLMVSFCSAGQNESREAHTLVARKQRGRVPMLAFSFHSGEEGGCGMMPPILRAPPPLINPLECPQTQPGVCLVVS
jgi:hypothetical protein